MTDERGAAPLELAAGAALLLLPALLLATAFGPCVEGELYATRVAVSVAREVAAGSEIEEAVGRFDGIDPRLVTVARRSGPLGEEILVEVRLPVPVVATPWGPVGRGRATGTHVETIGPHRSRP